MGALVLAAIAAVFAFLSPGWTPAFDPTPHLGLADKYDARIRRDAWGIPHVYGRRDADVAFGLAYAHAEDDFETLQFTTMVSKGRLSALDTQAPRLANIATHALGLGRWFETKGLDPLLADVLGQMMQLRPKIDARYESGIPADVRAVIEAYADGLNYYAATHPSQTRRGFSPVSGKDVAAGFMFFTPFFFGLERQISDLYGPGRPLPVSAEEQGGSNAMAVAPRRSADGHTRLLINSHQPYTGPLAWYEVRLKSDEGWDMAGGVFPGSPFILHGFGPKLGWANTTNAPDLLDLYLLTVNPDNPNQYKHDGAWKTFEREEARVEMRIAGPVTITARQTILRSVYGPVIQRPHGTYAFRYAGHDRVNQVEQYFRQNKAQDFGQFMAALRLQAIPSQNYVYADATGRIAYVYNGLFPKRDPRFDWQKILPGDTSKTLWTEYLPFEATPQVIDPPSGYVFNANNSPFSATAKADNLKPEQFDKTMAVETRMTNRGLRLFEQLDADPAITAEAFRTYKFDKRYSPHSAMAQLIPLLLALDVNGDPLLDKGKAVLRAYQADMTAEATNRGTALATMTGLPIVLPTFFGKPMGDPLTHFRAAAQSLQKTFGRLDPEWQEVNRFRRGPIDAGTGGGQDVLRAVESTLTVGPDGRFEANKGDTLVYFVDWAPDGTMSAEGVHQFGSATKDASSPHYADQAEMFLAEKTRPVWFTEAQLRANVRADYRPGQRQ
jgi:penicillin amidase/acyl-homoserine-lactone acylase